MPRYAMQGAARFDHGRRAIDRIREPHSQREQLRRLACFTAYARRFYRGRRREGPRLVAAIIADGPWVLARRAEEGALVQVHGYRKG